MHLYTVGDSHIVVFVPIVFTVVKKLHQICDWMKHDKGKGKIITIFTVTEDTVCVCK